MIKFLKKLFSIKSRTRDIEDRVRKLEEFNISVATAISDQYKIITNLTKTQYYILNQVVQIQSMLNQTPEEKSLDTFDFQTDEDDFIN